jgi:multiple sugar transport system substrate-binding protein
MEERMKSFVSALTLVLVLAFTLIMAINIEPVRATGAIYIGADGSVDLPAAPVELTVISLWSGAEEANFLQVLGNFTENNGINTTHIGYSTQELKATIPTQLAANASTFNVALVPWPADILNWAGRGYLTEVTDLINASKYPSGFINSVKDSDGKIWAVPFKASAKPGFWYRPSVWQANGWTVPTSTTTYAQFKTLLATIKADGASITGFKAPIVSGDTTGWPLSDTAEAFIMGLGGYQLQEELIAGTINWTSPEVTNVFSNLTELLDQGYFGTPVEWTAPIADLWDGKYAMYFQGSFITAQPTVLNKSDFAFFPFPGWTGETNGVGGSVDYVVLPKFTANMDSAKKLVEYLAGADSQEIMVKLGGFMATNTDVPSTAYNPVDLTVLNFISKPTVHIVGDLDDSIGGAFQLLFWDQLKLLWANPSTATMINVLNTLQAAASQQPITWIVDDYGPGLFQVIQEVIKIANQGDTIYVHNGTYYENLFLNKSLKLIGENPETTIIDGGGAGDTIQVVTDNVTISGFTLQNGASGISLNHSKGDTITSNIITLNSLNGIEHYHSNNNIIRDNNVTLNSHAGIWLWNSSINIINHNYVSSNTWQGIVTSTSSNYNQISENTVTDTQIEGGIVLVESTDNSVNCNNVIENWQGIMLENSSSNTIYHNNFINNTVQAYVTSGYINFWDDDYPSGGNYWSNYADLDAHKGPGQNQTGSDGVWDHSYAIDEDNQDRYPLTGSFGGPAGDVDGDQDLDISDIILMAGVYGVKYPNLQYDRLCDVNLDGYINICDIVLAAGNYGTSW